MAKPASRTSGRSGGSSVMAGVLIGLAIAAALAVGVALWVTGSNPFKTTTAPPLPAAATPGAPATPEPAPSFDFYKVLPGDAPAELPAAPTADAPAVRYYLQAGAFQNPADADNLKAQLALLGIEAAIQTTEVADKGTFHRVRIGPFDAMGDVERTRKLLAQNNLPATLVRETPTP
ncbi:MAG: SPOR domain-containing protein [Pseudomonadota bacterium]